MATAVQKWTKPQWAVTVDAMLAKRDRKRSWLARQIHWSRSSLSRAMAGHPYYRPNEERQRQIAEVFDVPVWAIFPSPAKETDRE